MLDAHLLLTPPAHAQVLADGYVDYAARLVDGRLRSLIKDGIGGSPVWREPAAVTFSVADAARTTVRTGTRTVRLSLDRHPKVGRHTVRVTATADGRSATRTRTLRVR